MQFSVPQFTDVEDKIIGPLTVKQFGIIFAAGVVIFLGYTLTKSVLVLIACSILFGLPALGIAFAKINGRPMYVMFGYVVQFILSPKVLVFHKQGTEKQEIEKPEKMEIKNSVIAEHSSTPQERIREVNKLLTEKAREEEELLKRMK